MGFVVMVLSFIVGVFFVVIGMRRSAKDWRNILWLGLGAILVAIAVWLGWPK